jgi:hypothetical protein
MQAFLASLGEATVGVDLVPAVALAAGREVHRLLDRLTSVLPIAEVPRRTVAALNAALQPMVRIATVRVACGISPISSPPRCVGYSPTIC